MKIIKLYEAFKVNETVFDLLTQEEFFYVKNVCYGRFDEFTEGIIKLNKSCEWLFAQKRQTPSILLGLSNYKAHGYSWRSCDCEDVATAILFGEYPWNPYRKTSIIGYIRDLSDTVKSHESGTTISKGFGYPSYLFKIYNKLDDDALSSFSNMDSLGSWYKGLIEKIFPGFSFRIEIKIDDDYIDIDHLFIEQKFTPKKITIVSVE